MNTEGKSHITLSIVNKFVYFRTILQLSNIKIVVVTIDKVRSLGKMIMGWILKCIELRYNS